ncbi:hypothetical protein [uncultured Brevundimonas sp.]|uniref:adenylate/guanylate cyclase domain-containing protein n=1 Tax=uncultured Brevundimonas sp. TaxID=213418 RepID=UPI0025FA3E87|nr:hypothetical protein [uncultured Brevundimonas sp.]
MTSLGQALQAEIQGILSQPWNARQGLVAPATDTVALNGGRVDMDAVMLYADLADSTVIAIANREAAARLFRAYLALCARLIVRQNGEIRSFDGDRIMALFVGSDAGARAVSAGLEINWAFQTLLAPAFAAQYPMFVTGGYRLAQAVGIDVSEVSVVRAGIRANNDLVWIGRAPNIAAKLSNLRHPPYYTFITEAVLVGLPTRLQYGPNSPHLIWATLPSGTLPISRIYCTNWWIPLL